MQCLRFLGQRKKRAARRVCCFHWLLVISSVATCPLVAAGHPLGSTQGRSSGKWPTVRQSVSQSVSRRPVEWPSRRRARPLAEVARSAARSVGWSAQTATPPTKTTRQPLMDSDPRSGSHQIATELTSNATKGMLRTNLHGLGSR